MEKPGYFEVGDDEIWKRRLREQWPERKQEQRENILNGLAAMVGKDVDLNRDRKHATLLKGLMPEGRSLLELTPADWVRDEQTILESVSEGNGVLCLFDHNLEGAPGYTGNSGILLLSKAVQAKGKRPVVCGLLTHTLRDGEEIGRCSEFAKEHHLRREDFLVLSKDRLNDPLRFADGLKMMALNHARDFLTSRVRDLAKEADGRADEALMEVDVYNFDYMVLRSSEQEGVWEAETLFRLFEILRRDAFHEGAFAPEKRQLLDDGIMQLRTLRDVETLTNEQGYPPNQRWDLRRLELYEAGTRVNSAHLPLELGDLFELGTKQYILIAQPCDLMVRRDGKRKAKSVVLARTTIPEKEVDPTFNYLLDYFEAGSSRKGAVKLGDTVHISPDVLDLAVFNSDGQCRLDPSLSVSALHRSWQMRFEAVRGSLQQHLRYLDEIGGLLPSLKKEAVDYLWASLGCRIAATDLGISLTYVNGILEFNLRRVGRYRQPGASRLLSRYVAGLARDAEEHDFAAMKAEAQETNSEPLVEQEAQ
jgi:hypothetical protein